MDATGTCRDCSRPARDGGADIAPYAEWPGGCRWLKARSQHAGNNRPNLRLTKRAGPRNGVPEMAHAALFADGLGDLHERNQISLFLLIFSIVTYVRDAGVAGSNPATPTIISITYKSRHCRSQTFRSEMREFCSESPPTIAPRQACLAHVLLRSVRRRRPRRGICASRPKHRPGSRKARGRQLATPSDASS
jgi:hypothetical protein